MEPDPALLHHRVPRPAGGLRSLGPAGPPAGHRRGYHYEIARIITPYDITGGDRPGSCTWILDVTDYQSLLHDSVTLRTYIESWIGDDRGWLVTIRFAFIPGYSELEPYKVVNLWIGEHLVYGDPDNPIESYLEPMEVQIDAEAVAVIVNPSGRIDRLILVNGTEVKVEGQKLAEGQYLF